MASRMFSTSSSSTHSSLLRVTRNWWQPTTPHPGKERLHVGVDDRGQENEGELIAAHGRGERDQPRERPGDLHHAEARVASEGVLTLDDDDEVEALVEDLGERMRGVEAHRCEDRLDLPPEEAADPGRLRRRPQLALEHLDALGREQREQDVVEDLVVLSHELGRLGGDVLEELVGRATVEPDAAGAKGEALLVGGLADLEELIEVRAGDGQEAEPLEQRD